MTESMNDPMTVEEVARSLGLTVRMPSGGRAALGRGAQPVLVAVTLRANFACFAVALQLALRS